MAQQQHLVPKWLLKRFANEAGQVAAFRRSTGHRFVASVDKVEKVGGFFNVDDPSPERIETNILAPIDDHARRAVEALHGGEFPVSPQTRDALAWFLAVQIGRGRAFEHMTKALEDFVGKRILRQRLPTKESMREPWPNGRVLSEEEVESLYHVLYENPASITVEWPQEKRILAMLRVAQETNSYIWQMSYSIVHCDEPLVITDSPVVLVKDPELPPHLSAGLLTAKEIRVPIGRHLLLLLRPRSRECREQLYRVPADTSAQINRYNAAWAFDWIYHHPADDPLRGIELPAEGPRVSVPD